VQFSVFECEVNPAQWTALKCRLINEIDVSADSLRFYFLGANWRRRVEHVGANRRGTRMAHLCCDLSGARTASEHA
jgi:CRISPR-associated protein Cas2